jgi:hypothetical protein
MPKFIEIEVPNSWQHVRQVRHAVQEAMANISPEVRSAAVMTASEMAENAIKYGEGATISVEITPNEVCLVTTSRVHRVEDVLELLATVERIRNSPDKEALYAQRLQCILEHPEAIGKFGLFRISFDARFELSAIYEEPFVTLKATRRIA